MGNQINWVRGNILPLAIPLEKDIITENGRTTEAYIPPTGSVISVVLTSDYKKYAFTPTMSTNVAQVYVDATVGTGEYGVEILVTEPDGTPRRSKWCKIVVIHDCNDGVVEEWDEFAEINGVLLDASIFYFAKGDKGDTGDTGNGIASTVLNDDYTLTITMTDGTSYTTPSIRGEQGIQGIQGEVGPQGYTFIPTVDDSSNISWTNDGGLPNPETKNIKGVGVQSIEQISTSTESGGENVIRVTLTNGETADFIIHNGSYATPEYDTATEVLTI